MLFELIEQFDVITIFRHVAADGDALGSQFGLKEFIKAAYPSKEVYCLGNDIGSHGWLFDDIDQCEDDVIKNSLAIVCDTANAARIDDSRFASARQIVKIDHHPGGDEYAHYEFVDTSASATCEVITSLLREQNKEITKKCAEYLYYGLATDTNNFTIESVRKSTFYDAAYLLDTGLNLGAINYNLMAKEKNVFEYETYLRNRIIIENAIAYCIVSKEEYERFFLSFTEAKEKVYVLSGIKNVEIWCLFVEHHSEDGVIYYNGSLRSLRTVINTIANNYQGGGHKLACGVKKLTADDIQQLLKDLMHAV